MAVNKFMHPRNIYKIPPDFGRLAALYPEFSSISKLDVTGKTTIDFKDANSLRILTRCLLKTDFNLNVDIPEDRLVPTLPLRLNYILWLEDLLTSIQRNTDIRGLDIENLQDVEGVNEIVRTIENLTELEQKDRIITQNQYLEEIASMTGTGACAIYPLLAAVKNKWNMVGTETDSTSLLKATENVKRNDLEKHITLKENDSKSIITHVFADGNPVFDFCMCNPPFYSNVQELCESRSPARHPPKNGFTGSPQELITEGGELQFCRELITESKEYKDSILIFTTMVGHKFNLSVLIQDLKSANIMHTHTEFCQGRVTRWGLAWTYQNYDLYNLVPPRNKPRKKHTSTVYLLPELPNCTFDTNVALHKVKEMLNTLCISHTLFEKRCSNVVLEITANTDTWSNQRRKRRLQKRMDHQAKKCKLDEKALLLKSSTSNIPKTEENNFVSPESSTNSKNHETQVSTDSSKNEHLVHAFFKLIKKDKDILLEVEFLDGSAGKEGVHQILQYIKNNWK